MTDEPRFQPMGFSLRGRNRRLLEEEGRVTIGVAPKLEITPDPDDVVPPLDIITIAMVDGRPCYVYGDAEVIRRFDEEENRRAQWEDD